jgi:hypothetical protein
MHLQDLKLCAGGESTVGRRSRNNGNPPRICGWEFTGLGLECKV